MSIAVLVCAHRKDKWRKRLVVCVCLCAGGLIGAELIQRSSDLIQEPNVLISRAQIYLGFEVPLRHLWAYEVRFEVSRNWDFKQTVTPTWLEISNDLFETILCDTLPFKIKN